MRPGAEWFVAPALVLALSSFPLGAAAQTRPTHADADHDGIPDATDRCQYTAEDEPAKDADGCPKSDGWREGRGGTGLLVGGTAMVLAGGAVLAGGIALAIANEPLSPGGGGYGSRGSGIVVAAAGGAVRVGLFGRALTRDPHRGSLEQRASSGTWVCTKLTVDVAELGDAAEVYFQFDPELGVGEFSEKEPEYRESLFRALRWAMRYETPPRVPAP